jgi:hypothetical protein
LKRQRKPRLRSLRPKKKKRKRKTTKRNSS